MYMYTKEKKKKRIVARWMLRVQRHANAADCNHSPSVNYKEYKEKGVTLQYYYYIYMYIFFFMSVYIYIKTTFHIGIV